MNQEQITSLVRTIMQVLGGVVATQSWYSDQLWLAITSGVIVVAVTVWGLWARNNTNLVASAASVPAVDKIVAQPAMAANVASSKVVAPGEVYVSKP